MRHAALSQCGSGWVWLCATPEGNLSVVRTCNQDTPLPLRPLLCCDLWEHAYYLRHRSRRGDYFDSWWLLVDWPQVSGDMEAAGVINHSLSNFDAVCEVAAEEGRIRPEDIARLKQFRANPSDESWING